jgi:excisionase family DNA binding protein
MKFWGSFTLKLNSSGSRKKHWSNVAKKQPTRNEAEALRMGPNEHERGEPKFGSRRTDQALNAFSQSRLLTIPQAATYLNTTRWAIKSMIWSRELPIVPLGKRYMLDISDLDEVVARRKRLV